MWTTWFTSIMKDHRLTREAIAVLGVLLERLDFVELRGIDVDELGYRSHQTSSEARSSIRLLTASGYLHGDLKLDAYRLILNGRENSIAEGSRPVVYPMPKSITIPAIEPTRAFPIIVDGEHCLIENVIYGLVDPRDLNAVRYVGQTRDPKHRMREHRQNGSQSISRWVRRLADEGTSPWMIELQRARWTQVEAIEQAWIERFRAIGLADLNFQVIARSP